jgi:acyl dehydratase
MLGKLASASLLASIVTAAACNTAAARSPYDGTWNLTVQTLRGMCDPTYNFQVNIANGIVTHPNLVRFSGVVSSGGRVRASVTVQDKHASGSGRLTRTTGSGRWAGYSGSDRCSGNWYAQRY